MKNSFTDTCFILLITAELSTYFAGLSPTSLHSNTGNFLQLVTDGWCIKSSGSLNNIQGLL